ncbi:MAG: class D sortase [bacterium]|nr:class D sortase [bacterium]
MSKDAEQAADVVRAKINALYRSAPSAAAELKKSEKVVGHESKHQKYMIDLSASGKSLHEIQTAWHDYYQNLTDTKKHEVWQEFYETHSRSGGAEELPKTTTEDIKPKSESELNTKVIEKASKRQKLSAQQHFKSLVFGLGLGSLVVVIFLFGFFNERIITPFVTPSKTVSNTPIIIDADGAKVSKDPKAIIPKINVEIPVVYGASVSESDIQTSLEDGVVHMSNTPKPGETGNSVIVGHSSNNIFNQGKYKFAFVLLSKLEKGDVFYLNRGGTRYSYRVYETKVVAPTDVSVLGPSDRTATATLITCDPPGTSLNRLIVIGEQISPNPNQNVASTAEPVQQIDTVPSNSRSLWNRITSWIFG